MADLRKLQLLLIAWLSFCDITWILNINIIIKIIGRTDSLSSAVEGGTIDSDLEHFMSNLRSMLNEYSTGPVMLMLAVERFIFICVPFKAKEMITAKYYGLTSAIVIIFSSTMSTAGSLELQYFYIPREMDEKFSNG